MPLVLPQRLSAAEPTASFRGLGRGLGALLLLGILTFALFGVLGDLHRIRGLVSGFAGTTLAVAVLLSLTNRGLRYARWRFYLDQADVKLPANRSLAVFLAGFLLSVTPGKAGELAKAWMVRELGGAARPVIAVVVSERLLDLKAVLLLIAASAPALVGQSPQMTLIALAAAIVVLPILYGPMTGRLSSLLGRTRWAAGRLAALLDLHRDFVRLTRARTLLPGLLLSTAAWIAEGLACAVVVRHYGPDLPVLTSLFNYVASTLAGAVSMVPGGLVAAEGSLVLLLERQGVGLDDAMAATIIVRAVTLWFGVALGILALPWFLALLRRRASRRLSSSHEPLPATESRIRGASLRESDGPSESGYPSTGRRTGSRRRASGCRRGSST